MRRGPPGDRAAPTRKLFVAKDGEVKLNEKNVPPLVGVRVDKAEPPLENEAIKSSATAFTKTAPVLTVITQSIRALIRTGETNPKQLKLDEVSGEP